MDDVPDVEEVAGERGREWRSLSMRQILLLVFALYFAGTCSLFALVERSLFDSVAASEGADQKPEQPAWQPEDQIPERIEAYVADGYSPALNLVGDRYAISFTRSSEVWVTYSEDGMNWTEPVKAATAKINGSQAWVGTPSWVARHDGVFLLFFVSTVIAQSGLWSEPRLYVARSMDGQIWGEPGMLPPSSAIRIDQILGMSMAQRSNGELVLAFVGDYGDDCDVFITTSSDGERWEEPVLARTTVGGTLGGGSHARVFEVNGTLRVAHADLLAERVYLSAQEEGGWTTIKLSGEELFPYFSWVSAALLGNGSIAVAFDHLASTYLMVSGEGGNWGKPVRLAAGAQPTILALGDEATIMAYVKDQGIYTTFVGGEYWSPWSEASDMQEAGEKVLHLRAWIDGSDQVCVRDNEVWYVHETYQYPGLWQEGGGIRDQPYPTYINGQEWFPQWPNGTRNADQRSLNNYTSLDPPQPLEPIIVHLNTIGGRGKVYTLQEAAAENDYTTIIVLDDDQWYGAAWYEFELYVRPAET